MSWRSNTPNVRAPLRDALVAGEKRERIVRLVDGKLYQSDRSVDCGRGNGTNEFPSLHHPPLILYGSLLPDEVSPKRSVSIHSFPRKRKRQIHLHVSKRAGSYPGVKPIACARP